MVSQILEAGSPKSRCQQDHALSEGSRGESFLASSNFWPLPAVLGILRLAGVSFQSLVHFLPALHTNFPL